MRAEAVMVTLLVGAACSTAANPPEQAEPEQPPYYRLAVRAGADSAVKLAQFALASIRGQPQTPRIQGPLVIVGSRYHRDRRNGGHTEITMIVAIDRTARDSITQLELSAWALEVQPERTALAPTPRGLPTLTTTSPMTVSSSQQQPYPVTREDKEHWRALMDVLEALIEQGVRLQTSPAPKPPR